MLDELGSADLYQETVGTIRVCGSTIPYHKISAIKKLFERRNFPIEILFVGGNAGNQANKLCELVARTFWQEKQLAVTFLPRWVLTKVDVPPIPPETKPKQELRRAFVWRVLFQEIVPYKGAFRVYTQNHRIVDGGLLPYPSEHPLKKR